MTQSDPFPAGRPSDPVATDTCEHIFRYLASEWSARASLWHTMLFNPNVERGVGLQRVPERQRSKRLHELIELAERNADGFLARAADHAPTTLPSPDAIIPGASPQDDAPRSGEPSAERGRAPPTAATEMQQDASRRAVLETRAWLIDAPIGEIVGTAGDIGLGEARELKYLAERFRRIQQIAAIRAVKAALANQTPSFWEGRETHPDLKPETVTRAYARVWAGIWDDREDLDLAAVNDARVAHGLPPFVIVSDVAAR